MSVNLVIGSYDHEIRFWERWSGIFSRVIARSGESDQVNRLAISPDKRLLAAAIHKKYLLPSPSIYPLELTCLDAHTNNVTSVSFQGKWLVAGSEDGTIRIWDLRSTQVNDVCVHPNGGELISCDQAGDVPIWSVSLASNGSCLVAGNNKGKCYVWKINEEKSDLPRYQAVTKFSAHKKYLTRVLPSPGVKYLARCSADTTVKIWSISQSYEFGQEKVLQGHQRWVWDCAFSADSAYLVTKMAFCETVRQYNDQDKGESSK
ncbi:WD40-repeat-containing domain protein [Suillus tomentosus]|nr:WD40-repeat-containing domain protein [Suillus tomentosus]